MKKAVLLLSVILLLLPLCACGEKISDSSSFEDIPVVNQPADDNTSDDDSQDYSANISKEELLSMLTSDGGVWQVPGSMWYQVRFVRNGDELEFLEFCDGRWYEGSVTFSDDGTEMRWHGENNVVQGDVFYWEEKDINNLEYNEFYMTDDSFTFGRDYWVKGTETSFDMQLEHYGN